MLYIGSQTLAANAALTDNGDAYASAAEIEILGVGNNLISEFCATSVGTRIE